MTAGCLTAERLRLMVIVALAAIGLYLSYRLALPFLPSLTWAVVLAILLAPLHGRIERRVRQRELAAGLTVGATAIAVVVPLLVVGGQVAAEAARGAVHVEAAIRTADWRDAIAGYPRIVAAATWVEERLDLAGAASTLASWLTAQSTSLLRGSVNQIVNLVLTFYMLFYLLRDRVRAVEATASLLPLRPAEFGKVSARFADTVRATIFGTVVVAIVQGALGGLMFWWLGLPAPLLWGVVMGLFAIVPVLGAFVVWLPAAIFLALEGRWADGLVMAIWGGGVVATVDNILYPILVGNRLQLHTIPAFVGAVGGILVFGASGIVLGPATIAVTLALIAILRDRLAAEAVPPPDIETPGAPSLPAGR
ncbi:AI-2E family transporter [Prosthecomicrobium pneumaticum]|uniref:Putative PurR-regulated permease PerM n=1 Tax=Prosthecomicrobium pneumaticum TaxID=81895 RepID=A0A7W9FJV4_9HYPH|nr:AI-2E family transporter [Prosthecomicrobium pneumaticum]MBB5751976.1 putative PurR-regulated permease PerM [Prosthecomicrobium pneumaticum]